MIKLPRKLKAYSKFTSVYVLGAGETKTDDGWIEERGAQKCRVNVKVADLNIL